MDNNDNANKNNHGIAFIICWGNWTFLMLMVTIHG